MERASVLRFHLRRASGYLGVELRTNIPAEPLWAVLGDTRLWPKWGPSVTRVEVEGANFFVHEGMRGRVGTVLGPTFPFEIDAVKPGIAWGWRLGGVRATGHEVIADGPNAAWIIFTMPWWALFYAPVCLWAAKRIARLARENPWLDTGGS